jgi:hypothetical protein
MGNKMSVLDKDKEPEDPKSFESPVWTFTLGRLEEDILSKKFKNLISHLLTKIGTPL